MVLLFILLLYLERAFSSNELYSAADGKENVYTFHHMYSETWPGYGTKRIPSLAENLPIIIWWTANGNLSPHGTIDGKVTYTLLTCHNGATCYSTVDRDVLHDKRTRGILFYGTDVDPEDFPLPRREWHEWALIHEESPLNNYMLSHNPMIQLFNHTATFSHKSDYPLTTFAIHHPDYLTRRQPVSTKQKNAAQKSKGYSPIVYLQTHCDVPSDRDSYVEELMKYIQVDSYGECLNNKDLPFHLRDPAATFEHNDLLDLLAEYKFALAFENAYCDDYMTEKLIRPLHIGVVPIYKGSPVVQKWMPNNHSIIMIEDFNSPKELAEFITYLDNNDEEYEKYLEFKIKGITNSHLINYLEKREWEEGMKDFFRGFECHLCKQLAERMEAEQKKKLNPAVTLPPIRIANSSHLGCPMPQRLQIQGKEEQL